MTYGLWSQYVPPSRQDRSTLGYSNILFALGLLCNKASIIWDTSQSRATTWRTTIGTSNVTNWSTCRNSILHFIDYCYLTSIVYCLFWTNGCFSTPLYRCLLLVWLWLSYNRMCFLPRHNRLLFLPRLLWDLHFWSFIRPILPDLGTCPTHALSFPSSIISCRCSRASF